MLVRDRAVWPFNICLVRFAWIVSNLFWANLEQCHLEAFLRKNESISETLSNKSDSKKYDISFFHKQKRTLDEIGNVFNKKWVIESIDTSLYQTFNSLTFNGRFSMMKWWQKYYFEPTVSMSRICQFSI